MSEDTVKKINRIGMTYIIDNVRTACINIQNHLEDFNPKTDDPLFVKKWDIIKETQELSEFLALFENQTEWDIRDNEDSFDKL